MHHNRQKTATILGCTKSLLGFSKGALVEESAVC